MGIYFERKKKLFSSKRKAEIAGMVIAAVSALLFVLLCFPLGGFNRFFLGCFGIAVYPVAMLLVVFGIGMFLSNKYRLQKRYFVYLILNFFFLACLLHAAVGSGALRSASFGGFGSYLKNCFYVSPKITVGGAIIGLIVYPFVCLIGVVGTCIIFSILLCIFVGLAVDFMFVKKNRLSRKDYEKNRRVIDDVSYGSSFSSISQDFGTRSEKLVPKKFEREDLERYEQIQGANKGAAYYSNRLNGLSVDDINEDTAEVEGGELSYSKIDDGKDSLSSRENAIDLLFGSKENVAMVQKTNISKNPEEKYPSKYDPSIFSSKKEYITTPILPDYLNYKEIDRQMVLDRNRPQEKNEVDEQEVVEEKNSEKFSGGFIPSISVAEEVSEEIDDGNIQDGEIESSDKFGDKLNIIGENNIDNKPAAARIAPNSFIRSLGIETNVSVEKPSDDVDDILPKPNFGRNVEIGDDLDAQQIRRPKFGRGPDLQPRKTPDRSSVRRNISDMVVDESKELPKISAPSPLNFGERPLKNSGPVQASFLETNKPSFNVTKKQLEDTKYVSPDPRLLTTVSDDPNKVSGDVEKRSKVLEETLDSFKISAKVVNVIKGPSVTRYELQVPAGIPVKKLTNYENDIAMTLMSKNGVRLELPIPGKNAAGVEIPNDVPCTVGLRDVIMSREFQSASGALPVAIGKNINGEYVVESLAKMVHLLVAGSTGSGKSVFLHNIILSLMFKSSPEQLRFIMIDPKKVEFNIYNGMPHMMLPNVVTECDKAINSLAWATKEMDRRYRLFNQNLVNNIKSFNLCDAVKNGEEKKMPYIVIVIDELADLMMLAQKEVSKHIQRIAQLGRACGIHLVIATQRPTVNVVTGTIKANLPTRVAFSLTSATDSQTILDEGGAEKLIGRGDMLFSPQGSPPERLQSAFATTEEVKAVVSFLKQHNASYYDEEVEKEIMAEPVQETTDVSADGGAKADNVDEFFYPALKLFIETGTASTTMIQRRFGVGFARAARLVDQMELKGYVSPQNGSKKRNVYITMEQYRELSGDET